MNWKKMYEPIKKGDKVKIIKHNPHCCGGDGCLTCDKDIFEDVHIINKIHKPDMNPFGDYAIALNGGGGCSFPKECLQKI